MGEKSPAATLPTCAARHPRASKDLFVSMSSCRRIPLALLGEVGVARRTSRRSSRKETQGGEEVFRSLRSKFRKAFRLP